MSAEVERRGEDAPIDPIKSALQSPDARIHLVYVFGHGLAAQVFVKSRKVSPLIIPDRANGQSLADVLHMLGDLAEDES